MFTVVTITKQKFQSQYSVCSPSFNLQQTQEHISLVWIYWWFDSF